MIVRCCRLLFSGEPDVIISSAESRYSGDQYWFVQSQIFVEQVARVKQLRADKRSALQAGAAMLPEREVFSGAELQAIMEQG